MEAIMWAVGTERAKRRATFMGAQSWRPAWLRGPHALTRGMVSHVILLEFAAGYNPTYAPFRYLSGAIQEKNTATYEGSDMVVTLKTINEKPVGVVHSHWCRTEAFLSGVSDVVR